MVVVVPVSLGGSPVVAGDKDGAREGAVVVVVPGPSLGGPPGVVLGAAEGETVPPVPGPGPGPVSVEGCVAVGWDAVGCCPCPCPPAGGVDGAAVGDKSVITGAVAVAALKAVDDWARVRTNVPDVTLAAMFFWMLSMVTVTVPIC